MRVMTLSDFCILWFVLGVAVVLGLEAVTRSAAIMLVVGVC